MSGHASAAAHAACAPKPTVSFEFFPPKTPAAEAQLWPAIRALEPLLPQFVSVTYGAGGGTRDATYGTVTRIFSETHLRPAAHLTCVGQSRAEIDDLLRRYWASGVRHIVALRGDPPAGGTYEPHPQCYANAAELVGVMAPLSEATPPVQRDPDFR
jgi:methylenetetrahydrofolate reductase (NADPH)